MAISGGEDYTIASETKNIKEDIDALNIVQEDTAAKDLREKAKLMYTTLAGAKVNDDYPAMVEVINIIIHDEALKSLCTFINTGKGWLTRELTSHGRDMLLETATTRSEEGELNSINLDSEPVQELIDYNIIKGVKTSEKNETVNETVNEDSAEKVKVDPIQDAIDGLNDAKTEFNETTENINEELKQDKENFFDKFDLNAKDSSGSNDTMKTVTMGALGVVAVLGLGFLGYKAYESFGDSGDVVLVDNVNSDWGAF